MLGFVRFYITIGLNVLSSPIFQTLAIISILATNISQAPVYKIIMLQLDIIFQLSIRYVFALYPGILHLDPLMLYSTFSVGVFHNIQNAYI